MSLWLCRQEQVKHPYLVETLGISLYSSQELCYVIYHHPLLVLDGFVDDTLLTFLREELNLGFLALKLERWGKSGENPDEMPGMILQECDYYTTAEISRFRQQIAVIRKKHPAEYRKLKADELFRLRQYGRAVALYRELTEYPRDTYVDELFVGRVWNNIGSCYARMFQTERALEAYEKAYVLTKERDVLERIYYLTSVDKKLAMKERFLSLITPELKKDWDGNMAAARQNAAESAKVKELEELFTRDSVKRLAGETKLVGQWKKEYRSMV